MVSGESCVYKNFTPSLTVWKMPSDALSGSGRAEFFIVAQAHAKFPHAARIIFAFIAERRTVRNAQRGMRIGFDC